MVSKGRAEQKERRGMKAAKEETEQEKVRERECKSERLYKLLK